jgi:hypothetical protein
MLRQYIFEYGLILVRQIKYSRKLKDAEPLKPKLFPKISTNPRDIKCRYRNRNHNQEARSYTVCIDTSFSEKACFQNFLWRDFLSADFLSADFQQMDFL